MSDIPVDPQRFAVALEYEKGSREAPRVGGLLLEVEFQRA